LDGKRGVIEQMGQTRAEYTSAGGKHIVDEDAPKKSVTDGMVKCLSMLGFAGDIFSGQWDDSKYVEWAGQETQRREAPLITAEQAAEIFCKTPIAIQRRFWRGLAKAQEFPLRTSMLCQPAPTRQPSNN
jgi:hypothetical protein